MTSILGDHGRGLEDAVGCWGSRKVGTVQLPFGTTKT